MQEKQAVELHDLQLEKLQKMQDLLSEAGEYVSSQVLQVSNPKHSMQLVIVQLWQVWFAESKKVPFLIQVMQPLPVELQIKQIDNEQVEQVGG